jgi:two-component system chemotaxis response regulator CheY
MAVERLRVLVIEDDADVRELTAQVLRDEGLYVMTALDGVHALHVASVGHPHVIVLDIGLPLLDGAGFAEQWRTRSDSAGVPIVVVSGLRGAETAAKAMGAAAFHRKPFEIGALVATVRRVAAERQRRAGEGRAG